LALCPSIHLFLGASKHNQRGLPLALPLALAFDDPLPKDSYYCTFSKTKMDTGLERTIKYGLILLITFGMFYWRFARGPKTVQPEHFAELPGMISEVNNFILPLTV
jgi:hypothetical protein